MSERFWKDIPTNMFIVMAWDLHTMNLRCLPQERSIRPLKAGSPEMIELSKRIPGEVHDS